MGDAYPELVKSKSHLKKYYDRRRAIQHDLHQGLKLFEQVVSELKSNLIPGETSLNYMILTDSRLT